MTDRASAQSLIIVGILLMIVGVAMTRDADAELARRPVPAFAEVRP